MDEDDESMDGIGRLTHLQIPASHSDYALVEDIVDGNTGLSQGNFTAPSVYMQHAELRSREVVGDPLVGMMLQAGKDAVSELGDTGAVAGKFEEVSSAP